MIPKTNEESGDWIQVEKDQLGKEEQEAKDEEEEEEEEEDSSPKVKINLFYSNLGSGPCADALFEYNMPSNAEPRMAHAELSDAEAEEWEEEEEAETADESFSASLASLAMPSSLNEHFTQMTPTQQDADWSNGVWLSIIITAIAVLYVLHFI